MTLAASSIPRAAPELQQKLVNWLEITSCPVAIAMVMALAAFSCWLLWRAYGPRGWVWRHRICPSCQAMRRAARDQQADPGETGPQD